MKQPIRAIDEILFDMFANESMHMIQENKYLWAIEEGIRRLDPNGFIWKTVTARKEHECVRGHIIKAGDIYCQHAVAGWGTDWKFCVGCMAMLLYFGKVNELTSQMFTHWDYEKQRPVRFDENQ